MPPKREAQGELFPRLSIESIEARLEHAKRRARAMAPYLRPQDLIAIQGEIALLERMMDTLETWAKMLDAQLATAAPAPEQPLSPAASAPSWSLSAVQRLPPARWRQRAPRSTRGSGGV